jgi:hypothetical protein
MTRRLDLRLAALCDIPRIRMQAGAVNIIMRGGTWFRNADLRLQRWTSSVWIEMGQDPCKEA